MNILLISANKHKNPYPVYPLGLDYVAGSLSSKHNIRIMDLNEFEDIESFNHALKNIKVDVIGISLRNVDNTDASDMKYFLEQYKNLIKAIRSNSSAIVILGGSAFTIFPSEFMKELDADYGIIGEGERLNNFLNAVEENKDPLTLPGVISKKSNANVPEPWHNEIARKFDSGNSYISYYLKHGGMLNLQTKRGCSFKCIYCTYPYIEGEDLRTFSPDEIARTAVELQNAGAKYLFITDSALNCSYSHSEEVAKAFMKAGLSIPWGAFFAPTNPPADYYRILADAGLTHAEFGTESMSDCILRNYRKPFNVRDVIKSHKLAAEAGINIAHYLLFGGPGETVDTLGETLSNADKLTKTVFFMFCGMRIFPHTELYEIALKEGQISGTDSLLAPVFYQSKEISQEEIIRRAEQHANNRPNWIIGSGGLKTERLLKRMYKHGATGPLWERLIL